ncbi:formate dehydrogenase accessory sulfurtransferase FdhD [Fulvivirga sp. M361]|uniref:formate dehydrogenase accessory sulfurtransferase FdhD n=1 Tax=Fulvivirga sp. M361 TaxID=2594266 RepID=UPI00117AE47A|nr:formate dehydrogenase accessory sulfurtransferase FdhD [Fulvivirga sp. M361]TRX50650.1 formate dehydrogenase accessory sulfurtransferase FdhD [Fulvivirga sp. M361]
MSQSVTHVNVHRVKGMEQVSEPDLLAVEEPLEIRIGYGEGHQRKEKSLSITMRTPGNDLELATGFLIGEGIINSVAEIVSIRHCQNVEKEEEIGNVVRVELSQELVIDLQKLQRHFYTSSSCGVCGKSSIEAVQVSACEALPRGRPVFDQQLIHQLPDKLLEVQNVFEYTGGLHAAGLFDNEGQLLLMREDVGRHNAVDKLVGAAADRGLLPLHDYLIQVSGRASFELVQKALVAGIPILSAIGAPSSLAVKLAESSGMTLMGFVRNQRYNIYTGSERINLASYTGVGA